MATYWIMMPIVQDKVYPIENDSAKTTQNHRQPAAMPLQRPAYRDAPMDLPMLFDMMQTNFRPATQA